MRKPTVEDEFERSKAELEEIVRKYKNHDYRCLAVYSDDGWLEACFNENDDIGEYSIALTKKPDVLGLLDIDDQHWRAKREEN